MEVIEYLLLEGNDWLTAAKIDGKSSIRNGSIGIEQLTSLLGELLRSENPVMNFDEYPAKISGIEIKFDSKCIRFLAQS